MKSQLIKIATAGALATGMMFAQTPTPRPNFASKTATTSVNPGRGKWAHDHLQRMAQKLNLTDAQRQQAKSIFQAARQEATPLRQQFKQNREALAAAVKADNTSDIQRLAKVQGELSGKMAVIRSEAAAKFYSTLTPEQRATADQMRQQFRERMHNRVNQREHKNG